MNHSSRQGISDILSNSRTEIKNRVISHTASHKTSPAIVDEVNDILERMAVLKAKLDSGDQNYQFQSGQKNHQFKNIGQVKDKPITYRVNSDGGAVGIPD